MKDINISDEEAFEIQEEDTLEKNAERKNTRCCCWVGTWNNPTMTDEEFEKFFIDLENIGRIKYAIFQREKGEKTGTIHFQFFVDFKSPSRFTLVKELLPYGCHFKPMISTKTRCQAYCSKVDTRISGPYEIGEFVDERQRTDLDKMIKMVDDGFSLNSIYETFPKQSFMYGRLLKSRYWSRLENEFGSRARNIECIYVYGPPGVGKTTYVNLLFNNLNDLFRVDSYGEYWFTGYEGQDSIMLDEFVGQVKITKMNKLLNPFPQRMNIKGDMVPACFSKVYIVSNLSLKDLYKEYQNDPEMQVLYTAFCRRINKIIHFVSEGQYIIERDSIWEDIPAKEIKVKGLTKRVSKVYEYDKTGKASIIYSREKPFQEELSLINEKEMGEIPL